MRIIICDHAEHRTEMKVASHSVSILNMSFDSTETTKHYCIEHFRKELALYATGGIVGGFVYSITSVNDGITPQ